MSQIAYILFFPHYVFQIQCVLYILTTPLLLAAVTLSEILDLYLDFLVFTVEKVDSPTQVFPNILKFANN